MYDEYFFLAFVSFEQEPSNEYILLSAEPLWRLIKFLLSEGKKKVCNTWGIEQL